MAGNNDGLRKGSEMKRKRKLKRVIEEGRKEGKEKRIDATRRENMRRISKESESKSGVMVWE